MATIIDALLVTLGLDPKGLLKGAKAAQTAIGGVGTSAGKAQGAVNTLGKGAAKPKKDLEEMGKKGAAAMDAFRNSLLRTTAAILGMAAIKSFVSNVTQSDNALGRLSTNVGMSTQSLSAWEGAASIAGGSAEAMAGDIRGLVQQVTRFSLTGEGGESLRYFRAIGVAVTDARGKLRPMTDVLLEVADKMKGMDPARAQAMGAGMGLSEGTINLLMQGRSAVQGYLNEYTKANARTPEDARNAADRMKAWTLLTATFSRLATNILNIVSPAIVGLANLIRQFAPESAILLGSLALAFTAMSVIRFVSLIQGLLSVAGAAGVAGASLTSMMALMRGAGVLAGVAFTAFELYKLGSAISDYSDIKNRKGVQLTPAAQARISAIGGGAPAARTGGGGNVPRGIRNNNPGNLEYRGQDGASPEAGGGGRFAAFGSMAEGVAALASQLQRYGDRGLDSVRAIISKYAPANENNTGGYIASIASKLGVSADAKLNLSDPKVLRELVGGISGFENGPGRLGIAQLNAGMGLYASRQRGGGTSTSTSSSVAHVGQVIVQTQATDADGIARTVAQKIQDQHYALQANAGMAP